MSKKTHRFDHSEFRIAPGKRVRLKDHDPGYTAGIADKREAREALQEDIDRLAAAQALLWASRQHAVVILFQAMDAAGKDGTIKHVMSGVNPQGVDVHSFKAPTDEELLHHFLWRPMRALPGRGRIAIFNRSYYEEVLVVRVHPDLLKPQWLPPALRDADLEEVWTSRFHAINAFEKAMSEQGTVLIKFFLNVSKQEQKKRFLERLDDPEKHWKFSAADIAERAHWDAYMRAYEEMLSATSTEHAPWHVVPADRKWFTRACVADIIAGRIEALGLEIPKVDKEAMSALRAARKELEAEE